MAVTASVYERTARYTNDLRSAGGVGIKEESRRSVLAEAVASASGGAALGLEEEEEEEDADKDEGQRDMDIDRADIFVDDGEDNGEEDGVEDEGEFHVVPRPPREVLAPTRALPMLETAVPDTEQRNKVLTFQEYMDPHKGRPQFDRTMQHISGKEQAFFVEVAPDADQYKHVTATLNESIGRKEFCQFAVMVGRRIPVAPKVTKAEARAARAGCLKGEQACSRGINCESFQYSKVCFFF